SSLVNRVWDFFERKNLVSRRLLNSIDPAVVVINSVAAATRDVEVNGTKASQRSTSGVARRRSENGAVKFTIATTVAQEGSSTVSDDQNDAIPPGVTVIGKV